MFCFVYCGFFLVPQYGFGFNYFLFSFVWITILQESPSKVAVMGVKRNGSGGAFHPFKREKIAGTSSVAAEQTLASSTAAEIMGAVGNGGGSKKEEKESQSQRKQRRCWSPELHRRFLQALQQLGGSHGRQNSSN